MILITGSAGFIGFHLTKFLLEKNYKIVGLDNINNYYSPIIKKHRVKILNSYKNFSFYKSDITNKKSLEKIFKKHKFKIVINLAAQAGVRFSFLKPETYFNINVNGFINIINLVKDYKVKTFLYASSSSVYGSNSKISKIKEEDNTDNPMSAYAYTKKCNELFASFYSNTYNFKAIGLRFFTVYGPFGRPDMFLYKLVKSTIEKKKINVFNFGEHKRDFTYIDDVVMMIYKLIKNKNKQKKNHEVYNLAKSNPRDLMKLISIVENNLSQKVKINFSPMQMGDVKQTNANNTKVVKITGYKPKIDIEIGVKNFIEWFKNYHSV